MRACRRLHWCPKYLSPVKIYPPVKFVLGAAAAITSAPFYLPLENSPSRENPSPENLLLLLCVRSTRDLLAIAKFLVDVILINIPGSELPQI